MKNQTNIIRSSEKGSVLLVTLILMVGFSALVSGSLTVMVAEHTKGLRRQQAAKVTMLAEGQLELAKNIVNASSYDVNLNNLALLNALTQPNQVIPGTDVRVEQIGATEYYTLRTQATAHGITKSAEAIVRQVSPASANNLLVIDHPVGISGQPRGAIHSNRYIDFYFPGGVYRDQVSASEGFNFVAGADKGNTTFSGPVNPNAAKANPLDKVDFDKLWTKADLLSVTSDLVGEIELKGDLVEVKLFRPAYEEQVPAIRTRTVFSHYKTVNYIKRVAVYEYYTYDYTYTIYKTEYYTETVRKPVYAWRDATRSVTVPVYEDQVVEYTVSVPVYSTRTVQVKTEDLVWISFDSMESGTSSSGGTVGATAGATGFWKKVYSTVDKEEKYISSYTEEIRTRTEKVLTGSDTYEETYQQQYIDYWEDVEVSRSRQVPDGTKTVQKTGRTRTGYEDVERSYQFPVYKRVEETYMKTVKHAEKLVSTSTVPANGTIYLKGDIRKLSGQMNGRLSLITSGSVKITGDLQYVDDYGNTRMLNGKDVSEPYIDNPDYTGSSLLAVMSQGDIIYSKDSPTQLEINASLISAQGSIKFEGIGISEDGTDVWTEYKDKEKHTRESLRRLGGLVSRTRPIVSYIDERGFVAAGYESGESIMDQNLILSSGNNSPPPYMFESAVPAWIINTSGLQLGIIK